MEKFVIVGFPKCGQNSLIEYLRKKHGLPVVGRDGRPLVTKNEFIWHNDAFEKMKKLDYDGYKCVIIKRDPVERIWSSYYYFGYYAKMSFEQYLNLEGYSSLLGEENPIKQSDYNYWIKKLSFFDPMIFDLEEISKDPDFPLINKFEDPNYKAIPPELKNLVITKLNTKNI